MEKARRRKKWEGEGEKQTGIRKGRKERVSEGERRGGGTDVAAGKMRGNRRDRQGKDKEGGRKARGQSIIKSEAEGGVRK